MIKIWEMNSFSVAAFFPFIMLANGFIKPLYQLMPPLLPYPFSCPCLSASQSATPILTLFSCPRFISVWVRVALEMGEISTRVYYVVVPTIMMVTTMVLRISSVL